MCLKLGTTPFKRLKEEWSSFGQYLPHVASQREFRGDMELLCVAGFNASLCLLRN